jgi:hypothetical protein
MPHPIIFCDDDLGLAQVRTICLGFPEAFEKISWGRPVFCAPKMFAMYGGSAKTGIEGQYLRYPHSILVKVDDSDRKALEQDRNPVDWDEVAELVDASFRSVAPRKLIRQLEDGSAG